MCVLFNLALLYLSKQWFLKSLSGLKTCEGVKHADNTANVSCISATDEDVRSIARTTEGASTLVDFWLCDMAVVSQPAVSPVCGTHTLHEIKM